MDKPIYIVEGLRSAIGSPFKSLKMFSAGQLAGLVVEGLLKKAGVRKSWVDEVILGNTVSAGTGQNLARQAALLAGLPKSTRAYVVNNVCGAGMQAIFCGIQSIVAKEAKIVVAGGSESASQSPLLYPNDADDLPNIKINKTHFKYSQAVDGLFCRLTGRQMGEIVEDMAEKNKITRRQQDQYALESHVKGCVARQWKKTSQEIVPISVTSTRILSQDDRPRRNLKIANLEILPSAFTRSGTVTAGNSSVPCDGAAMVVLASQSAVNKRRLKPKARILSHCTNFEKPENSFISAVGAIQGCLKKAKLKPKSVDLFEISEAFAAQMIYLKSKLRISDEKLNVWGGDIALGHPLGAAGCRVVVTLLHALADKEKSRGVACISLGGGGSLALLIELT